MATFSEKFLFTDDTAQTLVTAVNNLKSAVDGLNPGNATSAKDGLMPKESYAKLAAFETADNYYPNNTWAHPDEIDPAGYIGRKIEGGGTIFFDYALGYSGDLTVAAKDKSTFYDYHLDLATGLVVCENYGASGKVPRFYVVSDYDIGDYKHGTNLMWSKGTSGTLYTLIGTSTGFGTGYANTEKCIAAAKTDGITEWNSDAYNSIWHYVEQGDWGGNRNPKWFVPSQDELNVLLCMQWHDTTRRKSADGKTQLPQIPINFYSYYWSSSEANATQARGAVFFYGIVGTYGKDLTNCAHVRLVRTF